jgi:hypothetical protein
LKRRGYFSNLKQPISSANGVQGFKKRLALPAEATLELGYKMDKWLFAFD